MERREAIRNVTLLFGGAISASTFSILFESCSQTEKKQGSENLFSTDQESLITEIADVIIPDTATPGAKAAGVGSFIVMMVKECYPDKVQKAFIEGLENVNKLSDSKFKNSFVNLSPEEKNQVIKEIADKTIQLKKEDKEKEKVENERSQMEPNMRKKADQKGKTYFFQLIRELTLLGYFTSETGATKTLAYLPIPGKFDACVDLKPGQKGWAF